MTTKTNALLAILLFAAVMPIAAQNAPTVESRLREQLKALAGQLRTAETDKAALVADKAALEEKTKTLERQIKDTGEKLAAETDRAKKEGEKLRADIAAKETEIALTKEELLKAVNFGTQAAALAKKTEAERSKLAAEAIQLKRVVADQRMKNGKMFEIGNEILTRYEKFGFGTTITAREPFVGITRTRLESMVEEYGGKLAEQRLKAVGTTPPAKNSKPEPAAAASTQSNRAKDYPARKYNS
jgi:chromosome segregation ATPase